MSLLKKRTVAENSCREWLNPKQEERRGGWRDKETQQRGKTLLSSRRARLEGPTVGSHLRSVEAHAGRLMQGLWFSPSFQPSLSTWRPPTRNGLTASGAPVSQLSSAASCHHFIFAALVTKLEMFCTRKEEIEYTNSALADISLENTMWSLWQPPLLLRDWFLLKLKKELQLCKS